jgi:hypothetical protein
MNWLMKVRVGQEATAFRGSAFDLKLGLKFYACLRAAAEICLRILFELEFGLDGNCGPGTRGLVSVNEPDSEMDARYRIAQVT